MSGISRFLSLPLATVLAFATGAIGAATAHATQAEFTAAAYPVVTTWDHEEAGGPHLKFDGTFIECEELAYEGTFSASSTSWTVTPHYEGCVIPSSGALFPYDWNGCHYVFEAGTATSAGEAHGSVQLSCPAGQEVEILYYSNLCLIHIPAQTLGGVTFTNKEADAQHQQDYVTVDFDVTNLDYTVTKLSVFSPCSNGTGQAALLGSFAVAGSADLGNHLDPVTSGVTSYTHGLARDIAVKAT